MRVTTLTAALMLTAQPALPFDQDEFCLAVTDIARRTNARAGRWLDRSTRHDGLRVDCASRTVEFRRFLDVDPDEMRPSWKARQARPWNNTYCESESWREAIANGWKIISAMTFRTGDQLSFVAECE